MLLLYPFFAHNIFFCVPAYACHQNYNATLIDRSLLDGVHAHRIVHVPFLLSQSLAACLVLGEGSPHGSGFLWTKVQGLVLLLAVQFPEVVSLVVADDRQHAGYRLPHHLTVWREGREV